MLHHRLWWLGRDPQALRSARKDGPKRGPVAASASPLRWQLAPGAVSADPNTEATELVRAHLEGNQQAFQALVTRFQGRLLNFIYRMIGDRERAEDLVQEAFVRVHRHLHRFDPARKFSTWIYTIASNLAKNELRNRSRSPLVMFSALRDRFRDDPLMPVQYEDLHSRADEMFHNRDLRELVERTVARLSPRHREVFVLRELEGKSYEEIAEVMHCNIGTVKSRLNRARQSFAALIGPQLE